jgi:hypothetical protein
VSLPPDRHRPGTGWRCGITLTLGVFCVLAFPSVASAYLPGTSPPIPVAFDGGFLSNLSGPVLSPGDGGIVQFQVADPLTLPLDTVQVTFDLYSFSPAPGGTNGSVPSGALLLTGSNSSGPSVGFEYPVVDPGHPIQGAFGVSAGGGAPDGGYAVRTMETFVSNGSPYRFESRGYFSTIAWEGATLPNGPNGTSELNLSRLGVDGITPETAVGVRTNAWVLPVLVLTGAGVFVAGVGALYYFRWGPGSRSGATGGDPPQRAPKAAGK